MDDRELFNIIAVNIKILRTINKLTQANLAEMIGVHEKYIGVIEAGKQNITLKTLNKIANALHTDIDRFLKVH